MLPCRLLLLCAEPLLGSLPPTKRIHRQKELEPWQKRLPCSDQGTPVLMAPKPRPPPCRGDSLMWSRLAQDIWVGGRGDGSSRGLLSGGHEGEQLPLGFSIS